MINESCECNEWNENCDEAEWYIQVFMDTFKYCPYCGRKLEEYESDRPGGGRWKVTGPRNKEDKCST